MGLDFWNWDWGGAIQNNDDALGGAATGALGGAATGAALGSAVPIIGTGIGAVAGGLIGGIGGWLNGSEQDRRDNALKQIAAPTPAPQKAPNPYADPNNAGLLAKIRTERGQIDRSFDLADRNARVAAAASGRGGMGLGRAMQENLVGERAGAFAKSEAGLRQQNALLAASFDQGESDRILGGQQFDATAGQRRFLLDQMISADDEAAWGDSARTLGMLLPYLAAKGTAPTSGARYSGFGGGMA